jgi:hypothetical protein
MQAPPSLGVVMFAGIVSLNAYACEAVVFQHVVRRFVGEHVLVDMRGLLDNTEVRNGQHYPPKMILPRMR